jgi:hypothetical protein
MEAFPLLILLAMLAVFAMLFALAGCPPAPDQ